MRRLTPFEAIVIGESATVCVHAVPQTRARDTQCCDTRRQTPHRSVLGLIFALSAEEIAKVSVQGHRDDPVLPGPPRHVRLLDPLMEPSIDGTRVRAA